MGLADGVRKYVKDLQNAMKHTGPAIARTLTNVSDDMMEECKMRTPVDTGRLRASWEKGPVEMVGRKTYSVDVWNDAANPHDGTKYAGYVEYGHYNRNKTRWIPAVYMLKTSEVNAAQRLAQELGNEVTTTWETYLGGQRYDGSN